MRTLTIKYPAAILFLLMIIVAIIDYHLPLQKNQQISQYINSEYWEITGIIAERPIYKSPKTRFIIQVDHLKNKTGEHVVSGNIRLSVWSDISHYAPGWRIRFVSKIHPFTNFNNPGGFNYKKFMTHQKRIFGNAYAKENQIEILDQAPPDSLQKRVILHVQTTVSQIFKEYTSKQASGLLHEIVLGKGEYLLSETRDVFVATGVSHLLAISGLHMGMIAMTALFLSTWLFRRSEKLCLYGWSDYCAAIPAFFLMLFYFIISGMSPSAQRAFIMITVFLCAQVFSKEQIAINTLCFAGSLILMWDLRSLSDISFQMSFCAVFFIITGFQRIPEHWREISKKKAVQYVWQMLLCSTLAIIATSPLALHYFYHTSFMGLITNLFAIPVIGFIILPFALLSVFFVFLWKSIAIHMIVLCGYASDTIILLIQNMNKFSHPFEYYGHLNHFELFLWYVIMSVSVLSLRRRIKTFLMVIIGFLIILDVGYWTYHRNMHDDLRITTLDVGLGNAALVDLPGGDCMMVDGGGLSLSFDIGKYVVAPYLWRNKIKSLKTLILTHPDQDHLHGLIFLARHFNVQTAWTNGDHKSTFLFQLWEKSLKEMHIKDIHISAGYEKKLGDVKIKFFNPPVKNPFEDTNNNSLVFQVEFQKKTFLFTGDIEKEAESLLCRTYCNELQSNLMMCPHHGSRSSSIPEFIQCVQPTHVVISASGFNRYHLPDPRIINRYKQAGCQVYSTGHDGAVMIALSKEGVQIKTCSVIQTVF